MVISVLSAYVPPTNAFGLNTTPAYCVDSVDPTARLSKLMLAAPASTTVAINAANARPWTECFKLFSSVLVFRIGKE